MTVHYQNRNGEEVMISGVVHLQNVDDNIFIALMEEDKELKLLVSGIEGIYHENTKTINISKEREKK